MGHPAPYSQRLGSSIMARLTNLCDPGTIHFNFIFSASGSKKNRFVWRGVWRSFQVNGHSNGRLYKSIQLFDQDRKLSKRRFNVAEAASIASDDHTCETCDRPGKHDAIAIHHFSKSRERLYGDLWRQWRLKLILRGFFGRICENIFR